MNLNKTFRLIALGACLLGLSILASQKNPVARPFHGFGHATGVLTFGFPEDGDPVPVHYEAYGAGNLTHLGLTTVHAVGDINESGVLVIAVTMTAANGDQLFYSASIGSDPSVEIPFTGGTGRFTGATGSHTEELEIVWSPGPTPDTMIAEITGYYEGTVIY